MKRVAFLVLIVVVLGVGAIWTIRHLRRLKRLRESADRLATLTNTATVQSWTEAVAKVKAERAESMGPVETPAELRHYSERYWFLATQVAEVAQHNIPTCQHYFDLASMLQRGELVSVPGVTETYVLYGVAQRADESEFTGDENVVVKSLVFFVSPIVEPEDMFWASEVRIYEDYESPYCTCFRSVRNSSRSDVFVSGEG